jgi:hypothetical protein
MMIRRLASTRHEAREMMIDSWDRRDVVVRVDMMIRRLASTRHEAREMMIDSWVGRVVVVRV